MIINKIKQQVSLLKQSDGFENILKHIELCGRNCYKSEDKISKNPNLRFIDMLKSKNHGSVLEHGAIYLCISRDNENYGFYVSRYLKNPYSKVSYDHNNNEMIYITTNYRVIHENNWYEDLEMFRCEKTKFHHKRITIRIITDRRIETEIVRHRLASFSIESTRYCNYNKKGFQFIDIDWTLKNKLSKIPLFISRLVSVLSYKLMIKFGENPETARSVLLSNNKADIVMSAYEDDWKHFVSLRSSASAHPLIRVIAAQVKCILD